MCKGMGLNLTGLFKSLKRAGEAVKESEPVVAGIQTGSMADGAIGYEALTTDKLSVDKLSASKTLQIIVAANKVQTALHKAGRPVTDPQHSLRAAAIYLDVMTVIVNDKDVRETVRQLVKG